MSFLQRTLTAIVPRRWAEGMEAESRSWMLHCKVCGLERSVWEKQPAALPASCTAAGAVKAPGTRSIADSPRCKRSDSPNGLSLPFFVGSAGL
jgi:hypothetical protein